MPCNLGNYLFKILNKILIYSRFVLLAQRFYLYFNVARDQTPAIKITEDVLQRVIFLLTAGYTGMLVLRFPGSWRS